MKLRPLHDWVVIERDPVEENGFFLPSLPSNQGKVLAFGPKALGIGVGDKVQFNAYSGYMLKAGCVLVTIIRPADIVGIIRAC